MKLAMKIFLYVVIGAVALGAVFGFFGMSSIEAGFEEVLREIPFVDMYVKVAEHIFKIDSTIMLPKNRFDDLMKQLVLACVAPVVAYILNLLFLASKRKGITETLANRIKKVIVNMFGFVITILFVSGFMVNLQVLLVRQFGNAAAYVVQLILSVGAVVGSVLWIKVVADITLFVAVGFTLIHKVIKNLLSLVLLQLVFVVTYFAVTSGAVMTVLPTILAALVIMVILEVVCNVLTLRWVAQR